MAGAVPWFTPGISVADAHFMLSQLAEVCVTTITPMELFSSYRQQKCSAALT